MKLCSKTGYNAFILLMDKKLTGTYFYLSILAWNVRYYYSESIPQPVVCNLLEVDCAEAQRKGFHPY